MSSTPQVETPATNGAGPSSHVITSLRDQAAKMQEAYEAKRALNKPARPAKKTPETKAKETKANTSRRQTAVIVGTTIPPPRALSHLRHGLETEKSKKYSDYTGKIRKLRLALSKKELTPEDVKKGMPLLSEEQRVIAAQRIQQLQDSIEKEKLSEASIRIADNTGAALSAALDDIALRFFDLAATNTVTSGHKIVDLKYTCSPQHRPPAEAGGIRLAESSVAPFFDLMPTIVNYSQEDEEQLLTERREENRKKKEAQQAAEAAAAIAASKNRPAPTSVAAENGDAAAPAEQEEESATVVQQTSKAQRVAARRKVGSEMSFLTYVDALCKSGQSLHESYKSMRVSTRFKELLDALIQELIANLAHAVRPSIPTHTVNGTNIMDMLEAQQRFAGRPEEEIVALRTAIQTALDRWEEHSLGEKERRSDREAKRLEEMPANERAALEEKRRQEQRMRLQNSLAAQERRAAAATLEAEKKRQAIAQLNAGVAQAPAVTAGLEGLLP